jgi:hypothetical protein
MVPLHIVGGVLLWKRNAWGYAISIPLALTASVTFIALGIAQWLLCFSYQTGSIGDVIQMIVLAVIASGFSFTTFRRVKAAA